jgi:outer membrane protein assembly factor BamB
MTHRRLVGLALIVITAAVSVARAADWQQWRGPNFNGSSDAKNLPDTLDDSTQRWSTALPGPSAGTPIVCKDRVFISVLDKSSKKLLAMCLDRADGRILWSKEVGEGSYKNERNNLASPSPICDDKTVWFFYGSGDLVAFDHAGNEKWSRNITKEHGPFFYQWIYGSSPTLYDGKLYIQVLHRDVPAHGPRTSDQPAPSYLLAIDPNTGKDLWKHVRPEEAASESKESYGTPIPFELNGKKMLLLIGGDCVTAHDASDGKEIWRWGTWNTKKIPHWRMVPSVVVAGGLVIACAPKQEPVFAIKPDGTGDVSKTHLAWTTKEFSSDVCVPLFYNDKLYVLNGDGPKTLYRVEPKTGKVEASIKLGGNDVFRASPTAADGKIYCMNEAGEVWVIRDPGADFQIVTKADLGGGSNTATRSSIALADGQVFVRTAEKLYCFGAK